MLLQEQNALAAHNRDKSDKEGKYRSHDRSHDRPHGAMTPSKYAKRKHSIPERFSKPRKGSRGSRKTESHKTDSLAVSENLTGDIEHDSDKVSLGSYHSEPVRKSVLKERVAYYKVYHHPNGGFHVEKGPTADIIVDKPNEQHNSRNEPVKRPFKVPPLDLRGISSPSGQPQAINHHRAPYPGYENKENISQPQYNNFVNQSAYPNLVNLPVIQNPGTTYGSQPTQTANPGLQYSKSFIEPSQFQHSSPSRYQGKRSIMGFHGIVDPNQYTFYKPTEPIKKPHHRREEKTKSYKPLIKHQLPRQQMEKNPVYEETEENPEQNADIYNFEQNDTTESPQEPIVEQPVVTTNDGRRVVLPSYTDATQQQLPSNQYGYQDEGEVEYTPDGSPIVEESEDDVSLHLADDDRQYSYRKTYAKY